MSVIKENGYIHTRRLEYIAERINSIQEDLKDIDMRSSQLNTYRDSYRNLYEAELKTKKARLEFEYDNIINDLYSFVDELKKTYPGE